MADGNSPMLGSVFDEYKNLPSNSKKTKAELELEQQNKKEIEGIKKSAGVSSVQSNERPAVKKVVTGVRKKKPLSERFKDTFLSEESDTVGSYIIWDILIPSAKETISDLVTGAINIILFGDAGSRNNRRNNGNRRVLNGYRDYSTSSRVSSSRDNDEKRYGRRSRKSFDDIIIPDRQVAMQVLMDMQDLIADYGQCSVADYYDMVDQTWEPTDKYWGWTNLSGVKPRPVHGGCILDLPDLEQL